MTQTTPRYLIRPLGDFYRWIEPFSYALMRFAVGAMIIPHGWGKLNGGFAKVDAMMAHFGFHPSWLAAALVIATETLGGLMVAVGFLTRLGAAAIAIDLAVITFAVDWHAGYGHYESTLLWGLMAFVVALRGSGPFSVDALIGREL